MHALSIDLAWSAVSKHPGATWQAGDGRLVAHNPFARPHSHATRVHGFPKLLVLRVRVLGVRTTYDWAHDARDIRTPRSSIPCVYEADCMQEHCPPEQRSLDHAHTFLLLRVFFPHCVFTKLGCGGNPSTQHEHCPRMRLLDLTHHTRTHTFILHGEYT